MSEIKELIIPFLLGGTIIAGVKFAATHLKNPAIAAILGGLPTGLISIYFLTSDKTIGYSKNYFNVTLCLLTAILVFYLLQIYTNISKNIILLIAMCVWIVGVSINFYLSNRNK